MRSWSRVFHPEEDWNLLILWTGAQLGVHSSQSAGSLLLLLVRVTGARVRGHDGVQGLDSWIQARGPLIQPSHLGGETAAAATETEHTAKLWCWLPSLGDPPLPGLLPARMSHACCWSWGLVPCQERTPEGDRREIQNNLQIHKTTPSLPSAGLSAGARACLQQVSPACVCSWGTAPVPGDLAGPCCAGDGL